MFAHSSNRFIDSLFQASQIELSTALPSSFQSPFSGALNSLTLFNLQGTCPALFFPAGFQSIMAGRPSQELFCSRPGQKGLARAPFGATACLIYHPLFPLSTPFFPFFSAFFSPFFPPKSCAFSPLYIHNICPRIQRLFPGPPGFRRRPAPCRGTGVSKKMIDFSGFNGKLTFCKHFTGFERENNGSGRSPERSAHC